MATVIGTGLSLEALSIQISERYSLFAEIACELDI
jgi:hypothetical protein